MNFDSVPAASRPITTKTLHILKRKHQSMLEEITSEGRHSILGTCRVGDRGLSYTCIHKM
jgi:hypothetical protein